MDYHAVHGHDVASFDIASSHRLPTVSASAALDDLENGASGQISTGLGGLDKALGGPSGLWNTAGDATPRGGLRRSQVTEIWGPPGTGKTAFGIQLAANTIRDGSNVVWIDCFQAVPEERVLDTIEAVQAGQNAGGSREKEPNFTRYECLTLPHLIALISRPTAITMPGDVGLVVVDAATALINAALPRSHDAKPGPPTSRGPKASVKRRQALQSIMKSLQALASTRSCAVVLLSQCATYMQPGGGATLTPAVNAGLWDQGISTRLVLFRDWEALHEGKHDPAFLVGVQKLDGRAVQGSLEHISAFSVASNGIATVAYAGHDPGTATADAPPLPLQQQKRKLGQTDFEVPDSEDDEDYGWADEDEAALPPQPSQWQGSEDILLGKEVGHSDEETDVEEGASDTSGLH